MMPGYTLEETRDSANRAWVLGTAWFKQQIEKQTDRLASPLARGGDSGAESLMFSTAYLSR